MASVDTLLRDEARDLGVEEEWLLREIVFLEKFCAEIKPLLELEGKLKVLQSNALHSKLTVLPSNIAAIQQVIQKQEKKFASLIRILSRGERRRIKYEKRVLGSLVRLEKNLDVSTINSLELVVKEIHVYSARLITELSWRVGKISTLSTEKKVNLEVLQSHIEETLIASKALIVLIEKLKKIVNTIEERVKAQNLKKAYVPMLRPGHVSLEKALKQTAVIRSIKPLWQFLVKGLAARIDPRSAVIGFHDTFYERYNLLIDQNKMILATVLLDEELTQLRNIRFKVYEMSILIFLRGSKTPILGFNVGNLPDFSKPGWIAHYMPPSNFEMVSKRQFLFAPIESIFLKKKYSSGIYNNGSAISRRLVDGISFTFQEYKKYGSYIREKAGQRFDLSKAGIAARMFDGKSGALFIFPIHTVLKPGLILDAANTIDKWPEIVLRDETYLKENPELLASLYWLFDQCYPAWLQNFSKLKIFFELCKKNLVFLEKLEKEVPSKEYISCTNEGKKYFFGLELHKAIDSIEVSKEVASRLGQKFMDDFRLEWEQDDKRGIHSKERSARGIKYDEMTVVVRRERLSRVAIVEGEGVFFELMEKFQVNNQEMITTLIQYVRNNNFFQFSLRCSYTTVKISGDDKYMIPPLVRLAPGDIRKELQGTIFNVGLDYYIRKSSELHALGGHILVLTHIRHKPLLWKGNSPVDYFNHMKKMTPSQVEGIFKLARKEVMFAMEMLIKEKFRTHHPCVVPISCGVVLVNKTNHDENSLLECVARGNCVFSQFDTDGYNKHFIMDQLNLFFKEVVPLNSLPVGAECYQDEGYFWIDNNRVKLTFRGSKNKDIVIN